MKRYLIPYDGSEHSRAAMKYAVAFAKHVEGSITACFIADERAIANPIFDLTVLALQAVGTLGDLIPREKAKLELKAKLSSRGEELLEEVADWPEVKGTDDGKPIEFLTHITMANPPLYLVEKSKKFDVIFMGLYGEMKAYKAGLWGSTSESVIRKGASPVLIATSEYRPVDSIGVGFDNRPRARQALAWAGVIAENMEIPLTVLSVDPDEVRLEGIISESRKILDTYNIKYSHVTENRKPADLILEWLENNPGSLICLGAFGGQPLREFFLGSCAEAVLRKSKNPVMLFK